MWTLIGKAVSFIPGKIKVVIVVGMALAILGLFGTTAYLYNENGTLKTNIGIEKSKVAQLKTEVEDLNDQIRLYDEVRRLEQEKYNALTANLQEVQEQRDAEIAKLNNYRDRLSAAALKRPESISRISTAATNRVFDDLRAASSGKTNKADPGIPSESPDTN